MENANYRTENQFIEIMEKASNGNWCDAFQDAKKGGFFAQDLIEHFENTVNMYGWDFEDLVYIAEGAQALFK